MENHLCNSVSSLVKTLRTYGEDGAPVYVNELTELNNQLKQLCDELLLQQGATAETEAEILVSLFKGYETLLFNSSCKIEEFVQQLLDRSAVVLDKLPVSQLKCLLLLYCYEQTGDEELIGEVKSFLEMIK